jgi:predicted type IV restriction endonuclease
MDFIDQIKALGVRVSKVRDHLNTEEATKNAIIMPFIQALGYDIFDPTEVVPEMVADVGVKKGEKVDYAIMKEGQPILLVECKHHLENLDLHNSQLYRYFSVTKARFALLTNGITYRFYTDLVEPNKMDEKAFLEINLLDLKESAISELKKFHKTSFDLENILSSASELKYSKEIKNIISLEFNNPTEDFVKYFISKVYDGRATAKIVEQFSEIVKKSLNQFISDMISDRLKSALEKEEMSQSDENNSIASEDDENKEDVDSLKNKIETTEEELEGFYIVKTILREKIKSDRIQYKDTINYLGILLDGNTRKTICRLWLNGSKKYLGMIDETKKEIKNEINSVDDIYNFKEALEKIIQSYETNQEPNIN